MLYKLVSVGKADWIVFNDFLPKTTVQGGSAGLRWKCAYSLVAVKKICSYKKKFYVGISIRYFRSYPCSYKTVQIEI